MGRFQRKGSRDAAQLRATLAQHCARLIADEGIRDYRRAIRKAAERYGVRDEALLPDAAEIDQALRTHQRLFAADRQADALRLRRESALEAMRFLAPFEPRLVGPVADGTADRHSPVTLHLFSDDADAVTLFLTEQHIPHRRSARRLRYAGDRAIEYPLLGFVADDIEFELLVLPRDGLREAPLDRAAERPVARLGRAALQRLLDDERPD